MMAIVTRAAGTTAFEAVPSGTASAVVTATRAAVTTVASATLRTLETGARIAADTRGVAELFARRTRGVRSTRFAGEKNSIVRNGGCGLRELAGSGGDMIGFGVVLLRGGVVKVASRGGPLGTFVRGIGFQFRAFGWPQRLAFGFRVGFVVG